MTREGLPLTGEPAQALLVLASIMAWPAVSVADVDSLGIPDVTVTAQPRAESVERVPFVVNGFTAQEIASRKIETLEDLAGQTAGLSYSEFAHAGNITLRGIGTAFVSGNGESSVAVHLDGIFIPQAKALGLMQMDLGNIELLRGPQGTLYGRNSTAGVINMSSQAPTSEWHAGARYGAGNYARQSASAFVGGPLGERVRMRLFVQKDGADGYIRNTVTRQRLADLDALGGRFGVDADITDRWQVAARVTVRKEDSAGPAYDAFDPRFIVAGLPQSVVNLAPRIITSPIIYDGERRLTIASIRQELRLNDATRVIALTGATNARFDNTYDTFGALVAFPIKARSGSDTLSQEFTLQSETERISWIAGAYYFTQRYTLNSESDATNINGIISQTTQRARQQSISAFADATYNLTSTTRVYGGIREIGEFTHQQLMIVDRSTNGVSGVRCPTPQGGLTTHLSDNTLTGRAGISWDVAARAMVYVQASRGYKAPGFSQSNCDNPYEPETVNAFEIGLKSQIWNNRIVFNTAAFYEDVRNLQLETAQTTGIPVINAPRGKVYGADITLNVNVSSSLRIDAGLELLHARYVQSLLGDANLSETFTPEDVKGNRLNNAPDVSGTLSAQYMIPLRAGSTVSLRGELVAMSRYNLREVERPWTVQPGYALQNYFAALTSGGQRYEARLWVKNATNKEILGGVLGFAGVVGDYYPPRTYGIDFFAML